MNGLVKNIFHNKQISWMFKHKHVCIKSIKFKIDVNRTHPPSTENKFFDVAVEAAERDKAAWLIDVIDSSSHSLNSARFPTLCIIKMFNRISLLFKPTKLIAIKRYLLLTITGHIFVEYK